MNDDGRGLIIGGGLEYILRLRVFFLTVRMTPDPPQSFENSFLQCADRYQFDAFNGWDRFHPAARYQTILEAESGSFSNAAVQLKHRT